MYILVLMLISSGKGAISQIEFNSKSSCEKAREEMKTMVPATFGMSDLRTSICLQK